jgi:hypothetical protein
VVVGALISVRDCLGWFGRSLTLQVLICRRFSSWFCLSLISNAVFPLHHNENEISRVETNQNLKLLLVM